MRSWWPPLSELVVYVALPDPSSVSVVSVVVPSSRSTVPVGTGPVDVTLMVNVTGSPPSVGLPDEVNDVVVPKRLTLCGTPDDVLVAKPALGW